jgi:hypothetical protein
LNRRPHLFDKLDGNSDALMGSFSACLSQPPLNLFRNKYPWDFVVQKCCVALVVEW